MILLGILLGFHKIYSSIWEESTSQQYWDFWHMNTICHYFLSDLAHVCYMLKVTIDIILFYLFISNCLFLVYRHTIDSDIVLVSYNLAELIYWFKLLSVDRIFNIIMVIVNKNNFTYSFQMTFCLEFLNVSSWGILVCSFHPLYCSFQVSESRCFIA